MYKIKQVEKRSNLFYFIKRKNVTKVYSFKLYKKALIFALSEEINTIYCCLDANIKPTKRNTYELYLNVKEFIKAAKINPMYYLGLNNYKKVNLTRFYFYLVGSGKLEKLRKYI